MEITALNRTKRGRWSVYADGAFACVLHDEAVLLSGLCVGNHITAESLDALLRESNVKFAREQALRLLAIRLYSRGDLCRKLAEAWGEEAAENAVQRMEELGYVDDRDYARRFAADARHLKSQGVLRIARALADKGIDREIINEVLEEQSIGQEAEIAAIVLRKYSRHLGDDAGLAKVTQALARLGWHYNDIRTVLHNLREDAHYYDEHYTRVTQ